MTVNAKSIHAPLKEYIGGKVLQGKVHSAFEHVINLIVNTDKTDIIVSLVTETGELFPWSVILPLYSTYELYADAGNTVYIDADAIITDTFTVNISDVFEYEIHLPEFTADNRLLESMAFLRKKLESPDLCGTDNILAKGAYRIIKDSLRNAKKAYSLGDMKTFSSALSGISGLGLGLTPSGDDYLTAIITLIKMPGSPISHLNFLLEDILNNASEKTNALSLSFMERAACGYVRGKLAAFIEAMLTGENLASCFNDLLAIGSSSGRDLAAGFLFGFELCFLDKER